MNVISVTREVLVTVEVSGAEPVVPPYMQRPIRPEVVTLTYAGNGYVRVGVRGPHVKFDGTPGRGEGSGYWAHIEGRTPSPRDVADTSRAPDWVRELAQRYAPPDFTSVS